MSIKIAIQKSGRLHEESLSLLKDIGLKVEDARGKLMANIQKFDGSVYYLRNSDIPDYLMSGVVDLAILGENTIEESGANPIILRKLGFSKCRLSVAVPKSINDYDGLNWLNNKRIATSYTSTIKKILAENNIQAQIHEISGSVEIAPNIGLADAICDLVSSGDTLFKNGLKEKDILLQSEAVLAASPHSYDTHKKEYDKLSFRIDAVLKAKAHKYILMNVPNEKITEVCQLLPGLKSPSVLPLINEGWSSIHSVIPADGLWELIHRLQDFGVQGILITEIEKMVM